MAETEELGLEVFVEGWRQFSKNMEQLSKDVDGLEKDMKSTTKTGESFSVAIGTLAANAVMELGRVVADAAGKVVDFTMDSVAMAADFQSSMAVLSVAASSTSLEFDDLKAAALAVGGDTRLLGVSATGAAESLTGLFKAGLTATEIFGDFNAYMDEGAQLGGALRASIDLAAATELDMVQASDLAAIALASFGAELETETERAAFINAAMNNMVKAADASVAEVSGLAEALKMVGPTAGSAGISIEDVNNALALLSTRGIGGSMAGTSLNRMLMDLTKTTPKAQDMMAELGISVFDLEGNMLPLVDIIGQFEFALGDATDEQKAAALQSIFTAQGQRAMNTLLSEGADGWEDMAQATEDAAGIQEQAAVMGGTFNAQMEALDGTIETLQISIGDTLLNAASGLIGVFGDLVEVAGPAVVDLFERTLGPAIETATSFINSFITSIIAGDDPISAFTSSLEDIGLDDLATSIETVIARVGEFLGPIVEWIDNNIELQDILIVLAGIILGTVVPAVVSLTLSAIAITGPILLIIGVVALLRKAWESDFLGMRTAITEFWENSLKPAFETVAAWLGEKIPLAIEVAKSFWEGSLKPALETVWEFIQDNVLPIFETVVAWLAENIPVAIATAKTFWEETLLPALETVWEFIKDDVIPIIETIVEWLEINIPLAIENARRAWEEVLKPALEIVWEFLEEDVFPLFEALADFFNAAFTLAVTAMAGLWENVLQPAFEDVWEFIKNNVQPIFEDLGKFWTETLQPAIEDIAKAIGETLKTAWEDFTSVVEWAQTHILDPMKKVFDDIGAAIGDVVEFVKDLTEKIQAIGLPDWLTPGSPTPFELGLRGIADALMQVEALSVRAFAGLPSSMTVGAAGGVSPTAAPGAGVVNNVTNEDNRQFNLNTNTMMQSGQLALEFSAFAMSSR